MTDEDFMREALKEAAGAKRDGDWGIGCVITQGETIVARGRNTVFSKRDRLGHAEMHALADIQGEHFDRRHKDLVLYTTYEVCPMCFGATLYCGIHRVVCGVDFDQSGAGHYLEVLPDFFRQPTYQTTITVGILARECAEMWLSSKPAKRMAEDGYKLPRTLDSLDGMAPKVFRSAAR
jgi:tRNA(adenine34) deaminase